MNYFFSTGNTSMVWNMTCSRTLEYDLFQCIGSSNLEHCSDIPEPWSMADGPWTSKQGDIYSTVRSMRSNICRHIYSMLETVASESAVSRRRICVCSISEVEFATWKSSKDSIRVWNYVNPCVATTSCPSQNNRYGRAVAGLDNLSLEVSRAFKAFAVQLVWELSWPW